MALESLKFEDVDLTRHAIIEAAAGTGKTYTIENLIIRCIAEHGYDISQILVVTFTEKATGEMKERIRANLEKTVAANQHDALQIDRLRLALDNFDRSAIHTIHSFCNRALHQFAFENKQSFTVEIESNDDLAGMLFDELLRSKWARIIAQFPSTCRTRIQAGEFGRNLIINLATSLQSGAVLLPEVSDADLLTINDESPASVFYAWAVHDLVSAMRDYKAQHGLIAYDDMIRHLDLALGELDAPNPLMQVLRDQYCLAMVDEFQDTDASQWNIFRKLFACSPEHVLMVIGDPKQAIYGFRGADVRMYRAACREMDTMRGARRYCLRTNWRSIPSLIDDFNRLFRASHWFDSDAVEGTSNTVEVSPPEETRRKTRLYEDLSGRGATSIVDLSAYRGVDEARGRYAEFVADEIDHLLTDRCISFDDGMGLRRLHAGDICVLVRNRREAVPVEAALDRRLIAHSFYKKPGVYQSEEAIRLAAILEMLAKPDDTGAFRTALASSFLGIPLDRLDALDSLPPDHAIKELIARWRDAAAVRDWARLFHSIMHDTGVLIDTAMELGGDRRIATFLQIKEDLETVAIAQNMDILTLWRHVSFRIHESIWEDEQTRLHRLETEQPVVRIMTMHMSKGLQFPVVFIAGGFSRERAREVRKYHDGNHRQIFNLDKDDRTAKDNHESEQTEDNQRLLYVALTRAMIKLYLPGFIVRTKTGAPDGRYGMLSSLLYPALEASLRDIEPVGGVQPPSSGLPQVIRFSSGPQALDPAPGTTHTLTDMIPETLADRTDLFPQHPYLANRKTEHRSFTALRDRSGHDHSDVQFEETSEPLDELPEPERPVEELDIIEPIDLPSGELTGNMFHELFETLDFRLAAVETTDEFFSNATVADLVVRTLRKYTLDNGSIARVRLVSNMVWNTLNTPLDSSGFKLSDLESHDRLPELEFLLSMRAGPEWFMRGFIDLVFRRSVDGREMLYLLDWKSNRLDQYDKATVQRCMTIEDYHLQYAIYTLSLARWMRTVKPPDWRFEDHFGGVFYLFLRGMAADDSGNGVFHCIPNETDCEEVLHRALRGVTGGSES